MRTRYSPHCLHAAHIGTAMMRIISIRTIFLGTARNRMPMHTFRIFIIAIVMSNSGSMSEFRVDLTGISVEMLL